MLLTRALTEVERQKAMLAAERDSLKVEVDSSRVESRNLVSAARG